MPRKPCSCGRLPQRKVPVTRSTTLVLSFAHHTSVQNVTCLLTAGASYYSGRGVERDLLKAISWFEKAAAQNDPNSAFMLGVCYQHSNAALSDHYFQRARTNAWSSARGLPRFVAALGASEHFAKWHYLNFHHLISDGFTDAGRQPSSSRREVIVLLDMNPEIRRCVSETQKLMQHIPGSVTFKLLEA
jgi:hypothetical protein